MHKMCKKVCALTVLFAFLFTFLPFDILAIEAEAGTITVTATQAENITENNAVVYGKVVYSGTRPSTVGVYFGTSSSNMSKVASDKISHNKNPFDMWYDLKSEAGVTLKPGTTYYYRCFAIVDGKEYNSNIVSFKTKGTQSTSTPNTNVTVTSSGAKNITENNATVYGQVSYSGTRPSTVGIYFGTSSNNMSKVASDKITHTKNPFDVWYDLRSEAGVTLKAGTNYYYQFYAVQSGQEVRGAVKSFTTKGYVSAPPTTTPPTNSGSNTSVLKDSGTTDVMGTYDKALKILQARNGSEYKKFPGNACNYLTTYQLEALGLIGYKEFSSGADIKWAGGAWYKYLSPKNGTKTKTGYTIKTYKGDKALENIIAEYQKGPVYNIVVDMPGHVVFIHAIINNTVYFTDNYDKTIEVDGEKLKQMQLNTLPLNRFKDCYHTWNGSFKGAIHFVK